METPAAIPQAGGDETAVSITGEGSVNPGATTTQASAMALLLGDLYSTQCHQTDIETELQNFLREPAPRWIAVLQTGEE